MVCHRHNTGEFELELIIADYRMHHIGALAGALDIWQMAIAQSLLNNSEMLFVQLGY